MAWDKAREPVLAKSIPEKAVLEAQGSASAQAEVAAEDGVVVLAAVLAVSLRQHL